MPTPASIAGEGDRGGYARVGAVGLQDARMRWLQSVPGIGAYSAMVILAEVGDIRRFGNKRVLASYAELLPMVRESAGKPSRISC